MLAAFESLIGQLAFLLIVLFAWILRAAQERKQSRRAHEAAAGIARADPAELQARIEARLAARAPPPLPVEEASPPEAYVATGDLGDLPRPPAAPGDTPTVDLGARGRARVRTLARLGLGGTSAREAARRGVLWHEILGPPRALRPYRAWRRG